MESCTNADAATEEVVVTSEPEHEFTRKDAIELAREEHNVWKSFYGSQDFATSKDFNDWVAVSLKLTNRVREHLDVFQNVPCWLPPTEEYPDIPEKTEVSTSGTL